MSDLYKIIFHEGSEEQKESLLQAFKKKLGDDYSKISGSNHELSMTQDIAKCKEYVEKACKSIN